MRILILLLLLSCCYPPSPAAIFRAHESDRLWFCLNIEHQNPNICVQQSRDRCRLAGYELGCGLDDLFTRPRR